MSLIPPLERPLRAASASRATTVSSNGTDCLANTCRCSCPLPAITTTSPGRASRTPRSIASDRSRTVSQGVRPLARPSAMSSAIRCGSSERGLSDVTITRSEQRDATAPISGRFFASRSPPHPNTVTSRPARDSARRLEHAPQRVVGVREVHDDGHRVVRPRHHLHAARNLCHRCDPLLDRPGRQVERRTGRRRGHDVVGVAAAEGATTAGAADRARSAGSRSIPSVEMSIRSGITSAAASSPYVTGRRTSAASVRPYGFVDVDHGPVPPRRPSRRAAAWRGSSWPCHRGNRDGRGSDW